MQQEEWPDSGERDSWKVLEFHQANYRQTDQRLKITEKEFQSLASDICRAKVANPGVAARSFSSWPRENDWSREATLSIVGSSEISTRRRKLTVSTSRASSRAWKVERSLNCSRLANAWERAAQNQTWGAENEIKKSAIEPSGENCCAWRINWADKPWQRRINPATGKDSPRGAAKDHRWSRVARSSAPAAVRWI